MNDWMFRDYVQNTMVIWRRVDVDVTSLELCKTETLPAFVDGKQQLHSELLV